MMILMKVFIILSIFGVGNTRKIECTASGHKCRPITSPVCSIAFHNEGECMEDLYVSKSCDYCPETHIPGVSGPSLDEDKYPCRQEDGYFKCPDHFENNCVRRSMLNKLNSFSPCFGSGSRYTYYNISCTDEELMCHTHNRCVTRFEINTRFGCEFSSRQLHITCHQEDEFECKISKRCIPRRWIRDGSPDCSLNVDYLNDTSDEDEPLESCDSTTEFRCHDKTLRCIPRDMVMNGMKDCLNGSDEDQALDCNDQNEFRCSINGRCIPRYRVNDGFADCINATDENLPHFDCNLHKEFECVGEHRCIPRSWVGNSLFDCKSGIDEEEQLRNCTEDEFACEDGSRCLPRKYLCDGVKNCADCSDEIELCDEPRRFRCSNDTSVCIPWAYTCDGEEQCTDGSDERTYQYPGFKCDIGGQRCLVPQYALKLPYLNICPDKSDRCYDNKGNFQCARCLDNKTIISPKQLCDGFIDCPDLSDECCCEETKAEPICQLVYSSDPKEPDTCSSPSQVCNGIDECGEDERFCFDARLHPKINSSSFCTNEFPNIGLKMRFNRRPTRFCDGVVTCMFREDECGVNCNDSSLCRKISSSVSCLVDNIHSFLPADQICDGVMNCDDGSDEVDCIGRFECDARDSSLNKRLEGKIVSIEQDKICDLKVDCLDYSDETNCPDTTHFYCLSGETIFVSRDKCLNSVWDCTDGSDECPPESYKENIFSDRKELFKNIFMRICVWITGSLSIIANILVVLFSKRKLQHCRQKNSVAYCNRLLVLHLAISDFLMGISLFILANNSLKFSGDYCIHDVQWRSSGTCNLIGVLTMLSTQASINILTVLTSLRLYVTMKPMTLNMVRHRLCWIVILFSWLLALIFSTIPVLKPHKFATQYWIAQQSFFKTSLVTSDSIQKYLSKNNQIVNTSQVLDEGFWFSNEANSTFPNRFIKIKGIFGYYSTQSICFPNFYTETTHPHFTYSFCIITYNTLAMCFIAISYFLIYRKSLVKKMVSTDVNNSSVDQDRRTLRRRITLVVMTNNCCWSPICVMAYMSFAGFSLPSVAYSLSAVFLLPINSFLNPMIYSMLHRRAYKKVNITIRRLYSDKRSTIIDDVTEQIELNSA